MSAVEHLLALAGKTRVKAYTRVVDGKTVKVSSYTRDPGDMSNDEILAELAEHRKSAAGGDRMAATRSRTRVKMLQREMATRATDRKKFPVKPVGQVGANAPREQAYEQRQAEALDKAAGAPTLSDEEYEAHVAKLVEILNDPKTVRQDTTLQHGVRNDEGKIIENMYSEERSKLHREIIASILARHGHVPRDRKAVMSGGLGGAGKGYVLEKYADIKHHDYITIDPDQMKEELIRRGMAPEVEGLAPMETAALIHEESSSLAKLLTRIAVQKGMNIILDGTMANGRKTAQKADELRNTGYEVEAVFVDVPLDVSKASALARHRGGLERQRSGESPLGGRFVPMSYLEESRTEEGSSYLSKNAETFAELQKRGVFTRARVFDNSDRSEGAIPKLMSDVRGDPKAAAEKAVEGLSASQKEAYAAYVSGGMPPEQAKKLAKRLPA